MSETKQERVERIARIIDQEAWKAIEDGRDTLPHSLWSIRRDSAIAKAAAITAALIPAEDLIAKIAEVSNATGFHAGEPAMEFAGQIVSVLAGHPEHIARFMEEGTELFIDGTFNHENGTMTYRAVNGSILSPAVLRQRKGMQQ